jgi:predicted polyphosphate/ATP-dependent NAD kinase
VNGTWEGRKRVGLIVNPVVGMGGSVEFKGIDEQMDEKGLGGTPVTPERTKDVLSDTECKLAVALLLALAKMGARYVAGLDLRVTVAGGS